MLLLSVCLLLLFTPTCLPYSCQGTCEAIDEMENSYDGTCTKSEDCLVLSCDTPRQVATYHAVVQPRFRIYPCENPVIVNFQLHASYSLQTFNENRNLTGDTTFPETLYLLGTSYTVYIRIRLRQLSGDRILLGATGSFSTYTYTLFPDTVIPIDKSGCPGQEGTSKNPLCTVATSTVVTPSQPRNVTSSQVQTVTTTTNRNNATTTNIQTKTAQVTTNQTGTTETPNNNQTGTIRTPNNQTGTTGTPNNQTGTTGTPNNNQTGTTETPNNNQTGTTETHKNNQTGTTETPNNNQTGTTGTSNNQTGTTGTPNNNQTGTTGTPNNNQTGTTETPKNNQTGTTETPKIKTGTTGTPNIQTGATNVSFSSSRENSTISLLPNTQTDASMIGGIVGAVLLVLVAVIIGIVLILILMLLYKRRHITMKTFRYSKVSSEELALN